MVNVQVKFDCFVDFSVDESIFTKEFMEEFNGCFFTASIDDHYKHIAWSLSQGFEPDRIEGYPSGAIKLDSVDIVDGNIEFATKVSEQ